MGNGEGETIPICICRKWQGGLISLVAALLVLCLPLLPGPPDAPLDVQIEPGPSPGILIISWLPVTIDAAGTSNGVRVTGYAICADGQKVWPGDCPPVFWEQEGGLSSLAQRCPAPGIWALGSGSAKSVCFGSSWSGAQKIPLHH